MPIKSLLCFSQFGGYTTQLLSHDTYPFDDYRKYDAEVKRQKVREHAFLKDCVKAHEIGIKFAIK